MSSVYSALMDHKKRFGGTIAWRLKAHAKVIEKHLNPNEKVVNAIIKGINRCDGECPCNNDAEDKMCPCSNYRLHDKCCCQLYVLINK